jgi:hypothetical protein
VSSYEKLRLLKTYRYHPLRGPIHRWLISGAFIRQITKAPIL